MTNDEQFMFRALTLARQGVGFVSPNPMVGCVVVKNNKIIAEGYHKKFGGPHAEVVALQRIQDTGYRLQGTTVYVNLEPCAHFGKTPPCVDALIAARVKRVVIGMKDPNPLVSGKGIKKLRAAGIEVTVGVLQKECEELNKVFVQWITTKKPFVLLKCAVTLDGALTLKKGERSFLSSPESFLRVHELRQEYDAIVLGVESVIVDNPRLTTRKPGKSRNPVRVIFDTQLRIPETAKLFSEVGQTIIFVGDKVNEKKKQRFLNTFTQVEIISVNVEDGHISLPAVLKELSARNIASILVEGGAVVAQSFLSHGLVDLLMIAYTPHVSFDPEAPRIFSSDAFLKLRFREPQWEMYGPDAWFIASIPRRSVGVPTRTSG